MQDNKKNPILYLVSEFIIITVLFFCIAIFAGAEFKERSYYKSESLSTFCDCGSDKKNDLFQYTAFDKYRLPESRYETIYDEYYSKKTANLRHTVPWYGDIIDIFIFIVAYFLILACISVIITMCTDYYYLIFPISEFLVWILTMPKNRIERYRAESEALNEKIGSRLKTARTHMDNFLD